MWKTYSEIRKRLPDFLVKYELFTPGEGGRKNPPSQGYRCDFSYDGDDIEKDGIYIIHPEFLDDFRNEIMDEKLPVPMKGLAYMWIILPEMRTKIHVDKIRIGTKGYFMEGRKKVGKVEVIEILGLYINMDIH